MSDLPRGWVKTTLGELFEITSSKRVHKNDWQASGVPFYRAREIKKLARQGMVENDLFITEELYREYSQKFGAPQPNDLMITAVGTLGECYRVKEGDRFYFKDASVIWLRSQVDLNAEFVERLFLSPDVIEQVHHGGGTTVGTYTIGAAKETEIPFPPLPEQRRIVAKLDRLSARSAAARDHLARTIKLATRAKQAILERALSGEITADWRVEKQGADQVAAEGLPVSWSQQTLKESSQDISYGFTTSAQQIGDAPLFLRITDVQDYAVDWSTVPRCKDEPPVSKLLASGDIVIARTGATTGKSYLLSDIPEPTAFASYLIRVRASSDLLPEYLWKFMWSADYWQQITTVSKGTAQPGANASILGGLILPVPPLAEQREIVRRIGAAFARIDRMTEEASRAAQLLDRLDERLLAKAFRGELVPQDPDEEPAGALLTRIREARAAAPKAKRGRKKKEAVE